jgi:hypothetical protein
MGVPRRLCPCIVWDVCVVAPECALPTGFGAKAGLGSMGVWVGMYPVDRGVAPYAAHCCSEVGKRDST